MFSLSEKDNNGVILLKLCFDFLKQHYFAFALCFIIVAINLCVFGILLLVEYHHYGVHMFDMSTLYNLMNISFWNHIGHFCILLGILFLTSFVTMILRIRLSHYLSGLLEHKKASWQLLLIPSVSFLRETLRVAALHSLQVLKKMLNFFSFVDRANELQTFILGEPEESNPNVFTTTTFLALPLLAQKDMTLKESFDESERLLQKKFGEEIISNHSLIGLKVKIYLFLFIVLGGIIHFPLEFHIFPTLIICTVALSSLESFIENVTLVLKAALYNCVTERPFEPFTEEEIKKMFY